MALYHKRLAQLQRVPVKSPWYYSYSCIEENACRRAARRGDFEELRAARMTGTPWGGGECEILASIGRLDMLRWALENGAPFAADRVARAARARGHDDIAQWAEKKVMQRPK
jgi:hypothetical protein